MQFARTAFHRGRRPLELGSHQHEGHTRFEHRPKARIFLNRPQSI
jgi:hypothetical protein